MYRQTNGTLNKIKKKRIKTDNGKRQSDYTENNDQNKFDFKKMRIDYLYGHYPSIKAFAIHYGVSSNNGHFRRNTAGWAKEKAILDKERRKYSIQDLQKESLNDTLEDVTATIKNIGRRMLQTLDAPPTVPVDITEKEKMVKLLCAVQDFEVKQYKTLSVLCQEKKRRELCRQLNNSEITIVEFAGLMDMEGLSLTPSQMETLKAFFREETKNEYNLFDINEIERQDEEEYHKTLKIIEQIKSESEGFIRTRMKEVDNIKKELAPVVARKQNSPCLI